METEMWLRKMLRRFQNIRPHNRYSAHVKAKVIPVTIGATGSISESLGQYLSNLPGKQEIKALHITATLDTAHILWEVLM